MKKLFVITLMFLSLSAFAQTKVGTLKIFSELNGISVYVDEIKETGNIAAIIVPVGSHYLKVLYENTSVYGDLVEIKENAITTVLIKNTGQVQEKVMETKTPERQEYQNKKIDILLTSDQISTTTGKTNYYPGFYGYYGYQRSNTVTSNVSDFKIIQGGVKEISELSLATLAGNQDIITRNAKDNAKEQKMASGGAFGFLGCLLVAGVTFADIMSTNKPFLHKKGTTASNGEVAVCAVGITGCVITYCISMGSSKIKPHHYYDANVAADDAQKVNSTLKTKLGLPQSYDVK